VEPCPAAAHVPPGQLEYGGGAAFPAVMLLPVAALNTGRYPPAGPGQLLVPGPPGTYTNGPNDDAMLVGAPRHQPRGSELAATPGVRPCSSEHQSATGA
jgi:hypothetical protein